MPVYSHSRLGTFETCPRQYWFAYIEKPEIERPDTAEAFLGNRVHEALEHLYFRLLNGRHPPGYQPRTATAVDSP
jgi:hypothetical protein